MTDAETLPISQQVIGTMTNQGKGEVGWKTLRSGIEARRSLLLRRPLER